MFRCRFVSEMKLKIGWCRPFTGRFITRVDPTGPSFYSSYVHSFASSAQRLHSSSWWPTFLPISKSHVNKRGHNARRKGGSFDSRVPSEADVTHFIQTRSCCRSNKNNKEGPRRRPLDKKKRTQILKACQSPLSSAGTTGKTLKKSFCSSCCCGCWEQTIGRLFIHSIRLRHGSTVHSMGGFFQKIHWYISSLFPPSAARFKRPPKADEERGVDSFLEPKNLWPFVHRRRRFWNEWKRLHREFGPGQVCRCSRRVPFNEGRNSKTKTRPVAGSSASIQSARCSVMGLINIWMKAGTWRRQKRGPRGKRIVPTLGQKLFRQNGIEAKRFILEWQLVASRKPRHQMMIRLFCCAWTVNGQQNQSASIRRQMESKNSDGTMR